MQTLNWTLYPLSQISQSWGVSVTWVWVVPGVGKHTKASSLFFTDFLRMPGLFHYRTAHIPTAQHTASGLKHTYQSAIKLYQQICRSFTLLRCPETSINNLNDNIGYCGRLRSGLLNIIQHPSWAEKVPLLFLPPLPHSAKDSARCIMFSVINTCNHFWSGVVWTASRFMYFNMGQ